MLKMKRKKNSWDFFLLLYRIGLETDGLKKKKERKLMKFIVFIIGLKTQMGILHCYVNGYIDTSFFLPF